MYGFDLKVGSPRFDTGKIDKIIGGKSWIIIALLTKDGLDELRFAKRLAGQLDSPRHEILNSCLCHAKVIKSNSLFSGDEGQITPLLIAVRSLESVKSKAFDILSTGEYGYGAIVTSDSADSISDINHLLSSLLVMDVSIDGIIAPDSMNRCLAFNSAMIH